MKLEHQMGVSPREVAVTSPFVQQGKPLMPGSGCGMKRSKCLHSPLYTDPAFPVPDALFPPTAAPDCSCPFPSLTRYPTLSFLLPLCWLLTHLPGQTPCPPAPSLLLHPPLLPPLWPDTLHPV